MTGTKRKPNPFEHVRRAEASFGRELRRLAKHIGDIVRSVAVEPDGTIDLDALRMRLPKLDRAMANYAEAVRPWAEAAAHRMVDDVARRDAKAWFEIAGEISAGLKREIASAPIGEAMRTLQAEGVALITSLPIEAAQRVGELAREAITDGTRATEIAKEIMRSGEIAASRADLIARTEVGRASAALTQARAAHVGSPGYVWNTARDGAVRKSHREMAGQFVAWSSPPTLDRLTGHAGALPNCRCWPAPVLGE